MPHTKVTDDQFTWEAYSLIHVPTGARFAWTFPKGKSDLLVIKWDRSRSDELKDYGRAEILKVATALLQTKYPREAPAGDRKN
jgi:hypothetical protein